MTSHAITAIVLAKNEEGIIEKCLDSLGFVDKVIVIDNNSTDTTAQIAKKKGAVVITSDSHDFSKLRELGLKKITSGFVLYVDAD
ncbi:MAG TPA: glycosyltransferase, partial [Patescibacteria group bacterium]|nr:glycosyltransferase [Patescibacteria group bacterium]